MERTIIIHSKISLKVKENPIRAEVSSDQYGHLSLYACGTCFAIVHSKDKYCWSCATDISKGTCYSSDNLSTDYREAFIKEEKERTLEEVNEEMLKR